MRRCVGNDNRAGMERTAIVTGAGKRVAAEIAKVLLADGWNVVAHVRQAEDRVPEGAVQAAADLADPNCAEAIFAAAAGLPVFWVGSQKARS